MRTGKVRRLSGLVLIPTLVLSAQAQVTVSLRGLGGTPDYRWRDTPGNLYADSYRSSFEYGSSPSASLTYSPIGWEFTGTLSATGLKPNFTYQIKLEGKPEADWGSDQGDDWSNQQLQDLGRVWDNIGYLVFDYVITDQTGGFSKSLTLNSSFHVLWRTDQRSRQSDDGPVVTQDVVVTSSNPAYDTTLATASVSVYGERESGRPAPGAVVLPEGEYKVRIILTEESFHESGLDHGGEWAAAMGHDDIQFTIGDPLPIQLGRFTAAHTGKHTVRLEWMTLTEVNNFGFEVQKSAQASTGYETIPNSFVSGHGTTAAAHSYTYTDTAATSGGWYYRLKQMDLGGGVHYTEGIKVDIVTEAGEDATPASFALHQNYPNPFNPSTVIEYSLPVSSIVTLKVFNIVGQEMAELDAGERSAGTHRIEWNARTSPSGVYFYRLRAGGYVLTKRLILAR